METVAAAESHFLSVPEFGDLINSGIRCTADPSQTLLTLVTLWGNPGTFAPLERVLVWGLKDFELVTGELMLTAESLTAD